MNMITNLKARFVDTSKMIFNVPNNRTTLVYVELYMYSDGELFMHSRGDYVGIFPELHSNKGNKHQNNTRVSA